MFTSQQLNQLAAETHQNMIGWWHNPSDGKPIERNKGELLMLVITELAEACEGIRKNLRDDKILTRSMEEVEMADALIRLLDFCGGFKIEILPWHEISNKDFTELVNELSANRAEALLTISMVVCAIHADSGGDPDEQETISGAIWSIAAYCEKFNLNLLGAYTEKTEYNRTRIDHTHEARKLAGGKQF